MATIGRERGPRRRMALRQGSTLTPTIDTGVPRGLPRPRKMNLRTPLYLLVLSSGILAAIRGPVQAGDKDRPQRYGRIASEGVAVFNLSDEKGKEIARPAKGQLVAVYKETPSGWLEVEIPGGFAVWVFGRFLAQTSDPNVLEVTGSAVNLRPGPSSDVVTNFPLPQRLQTGDKLRVIELQEPEKPLAETWVRVWSPPGVRGCLKSSAVEGLLANEDGPALWAAALASLPAEPPPRVAQSRPREASEAEKRETEARAALEEARAALEKERVKDTPDYDPIEDALNAVVARGGPVAIEARAELRTLATLREASALKADLERERARRAEEVLERQQDVWVKSKEKDPLGGVFAARGVVERRTNNEGIARFYLRFGGNISCELCCSSGRYDLSTFAGTEVGVHGAEIASRTGELPTFEVSRLEVLAVR